MTGPAIPADNTAALIQSITSQIFSSANWKSEVQKTVKRNVKLQEKVRELTAQVETAKKGAPGDGAKVLTKEEVAEWDAYKALNLKPADIKKTVEDHGRLKVKEAEQLEEENYGDAAEALDFANVPAFKRWMKREGLVLELRDQRVEDETTGKKVLVKMPFVRLRSDDKAQFESLEEYIEREVPEFVDTFRQADEQEAEKILGTETGDVITRAARDAEERVKGNGVRVPATRPGRSDNSTKTRDAKVLQEVEERTRNNPAYSL